MIVSESGQLGVGVGCEMWMWTRKAAVLVDEVEPRTREIQAGVESGRMYGNVCYAEGVSGESQLAAGQGRRRDRVEPERERKKYCYCSR